MERDFSIYVFKKVILVICASAIIMVHLLYALMSFFSIADLLTHQIIYSILILSYGLIFLTIVEYYKYLKAKALIVIGILLFILMVGKELFQLINNILHIYNLKIYGFVMDVISGLLVITWIVWIIFLFIKKLKHKKLIRSLRKFAIGYIISTILAVIIALIFDTSNYFRIVHFNDLLIGLPYIFMIEFIMRLNIKNRSQHVR